MRDLKSQVDADEVLTSQRLVRLSQEREQINRQIVFLQDELRKNEAAHNQMIGRMRLIRELRGQEESMHDVLPQPEVVIEEQNGVISE